MKVALCTPCRSGYVRHEHMHSCIDVANMTRKKGVELLHIVGANCGLIARARNQLVSKALEQKVDWIVWVDDDIAFDAADFYKLIEHDVDVVGAGPAIRHKRWDQKPALLGRPKPGNSIKGYHTPVGRLWEVDRLATAFLAIRATVFKEIEPLTDAYRTTSDRTFKTRSWFWLELVDIDGETWDEGEDFNFCRKWQHVGGTCFLDPDIRLRHYEGNVCHDYCPADFEAEAGLSAVGNIPAIQGEIINGESNVAR